VGSAVTPDQLINLVQFAVALLALGVLISIVRERIRHRRREQEEAAKAPLCQLCGESIFGSVASWHRTGDEPFKFFHLGCLEQGIREGKERT